MSKYVVLDLEMCFVPKSSRKAGYAYATELIEIGAVVVDESLEIVDSFVTYVSPQYGAIDRRIRELTGITPEMTTNAPSAREALEAFAAWIPDDAVAVSWSESDEHQIRKEMECKSIEIPKLTALLEGWVDCQRTFTEKMNTLKVYRLSEALSIADINYEDGAHDALVDAHNTAMLFVKMEKEPQLQLVDCYSAEAEEDMTLTYNPFAAFFANYQPEG